MKHHQLLQYKIHSLESLLPLVSEWKTTHQKIVFTNGCFDLLHPGHIDYLNKAADLGDKLIVALNTDNSIHKIKAKNRPIQNEKSRIQIMASLECVSAVFLFDEETPLEVISKIIPDILVKGADYKVENIVGADIVIEHGGEVKTIDFLEGYSTSLIVQKILGN